MSEPTTSGNGNKSKVILIIAFIVALLGINVYQFMTWQKEEKGYQTTIQTKDDEIKTHLASLDSLQNELQLRLDEITALGGKNSELESKIAELEVEKEKLRNSSNIAWGKLKKLENLENEYKTLLREHDAEISKLKAQSDSLNSFNQQLKQEIVSKDTKLDSIGNQLSDREKLLKLARILKAESFIVTAIKGFNTGKDKTKTEQPFKYKDIEVLKIKFELAANKVALVESKEVFVQIKDPAGNVIYNVETGSGSFMYNEAEMYYSVKHDVLYSQSGTTVEVYYTKSSPYESGKHVIDVYCEGYRVGSSFFTVK